MDAPTFSLFLKDKLEEKIEDYDKILCSVSYKNIEEGQRLAGNREMLVCIRDSLDGLVRTFERSN